MESAGMSGLTRSYTPFGRCRALCAVKCKPPRTAIVYNNVLRGWHMGAMPVCSCAVNMEFSHENAHCLRRAFEHVSVSA